MRGRLLLLAFLLATGAAGLVVTGTIRLPWNLATPEPVAIVVTPRENSSHSEQKPSEQSPTEQSAGKSAMEEALAALDLGGKTDDSQDEKDSAALSEPVLDVSRISPDGVSVFAGRAAPNSYVTIFEDGKQAGTTRADEHGSWSLATEHRFASLEPKLSLRADDNPPAAPPAPEAPRQTAALEAYRDARAKPEKTSPEPTLASPSAQVMKTFEDIVAKAREKHAKAEAQAADGQKETTNPTTTRPDTATSDDAKAEKSESEQTKSEESTSVPHAPADTSAEAVMSAEQRARSSGAAAPTGTHDAPANADARAGVTVDTQSNEAASEATGHTSIPVPIMFVYNEAKFTPEGERAVALLLEYVKLERLPSIHLSGHADERGTDAYNMDLSRERLEAVARVLREGGYTGQLELTPKGKREPYMGVDRSRYTREALFQLDRRVELHIIR